MTISRTKLPIGIVSRPCPRALRSQVRSIGASSRGSASSRSSTASSAGSSRTSTGSNSSNSDSTCSPANRSIHRSRPPTDPLARFSPDQGQQTVSTRTISGKVISRSGTPPINTLPRAGGSTSASEATLDGQLAGSKSPPQSPMLGSRLRLQAVTRGRETGSHTSRVPRTARRSSGVGAVRPSHQGRSPSRASSPTSHRRPTPSSVRIRFTDHPCPI
jgi:hypothetical protein